MTTTYQVTARRDGRFWFIEIPALDGATQARNVAEIEEMARDYVATVTDVPESEVLLNLKIELPEEVEAHLQKVRRLRAVEVKARQDAAEESRAAARELKATGLTLREVGALLGVSHQRAQQLTVATTRSV